jgi:hypothetical protein
MIPLVRWLVIEREWSLSAGAATLFFLTPFIAGLVYHELAAIAAGHTGPNTPGWYLHILIGPISYAWAMGLRRSRFEKALLILTLVLTAILWMCQLAVFDGAAALDDSGHISLLTPWWHLQPQPLSILGFPLWALAALLVAGTIVIVLLQSRDRNITPPDKPLRVGPYEGIDAPSSA